MSQRKTVAIVGSNANTRELAPFDDPNVAIWVFNEAYSQRVMRDGEPYQWCKRADAVFQIHDKVIYRSAQNRSDRKHWEWLQQDHGDLVIYMQEEDPLVPNSRRLPIEALTGMLSDFRQGVDLQHREYLTSSISIAIATAILKSYDVIKVYGVEMGSDTEYHYQRDCVTFWAGFALGRGIQVDFIGGDDIFDRPLYGYEGHILTEVAPFQERAGELRREIRAAKKTIRKAEDRLDAAYLNGLQSEDIEALADANTELGLLEGRLTQIERYIFKIQQMQKENGYALLDRNEYEGAAAAAKTDAESHSAQVYRTAGHVDLMLASWQNGREPLVLEHLKGFIENHVDANYNSGKAFGIYRENWRLAQEIDKNLKAAGGDKAKEIMEASR